jgi:hypothetical protein
MASEQLEVVVQRDCLGGERVVELILPRAPVEDDLGALVGASSVQILRTAPRPFFRVDVPGKYLVTGILRDRRVRFTVRLAQREHALELALAGGRSLCAPR